MKMGDERFLVLIIIIISVALFYCAHWATYCTGQLRFSRFDVTEAQMVVIGVLIFTGVSGPEIWTTSVNLFFKFKYYFIIRTPHKKCLYFCYFVIFAFYLDFFHVFLYILPD